MKTSKEVKTEAKVVFTYRGAFEAHDPYLELTLRLSCHLLDALLVLKDVVKENGK